MDALARLRSRLEDMHGLDALTLLLVWDQRTKMPAGAAATRGRHLGLLQRLSHELLISPEVGALIEETSGLELDPDSDDAGLLRLARRLYDKAVRVPPELTAEMTQAAAEANPVWAQAKETSDFSLFLPALERNVELRRRYIACF